MKLLWHITKSSTLHTFGCRYAKTKAKTKAKTNTNIKGNGSAHNTHIHFEKQGYRHPTYRIGCGDAECLFAVKFEACNAYEIEFLANAIAIAMEFVVTQLGAGCWLLATD